MNSIHCLWNNIGDHINLLFWVLSQFVTRLFGWSCLHFPTYKFTGENKTHLTLKNKRSISKPKSIYTWDNVEKPFKELSQELT